MFRRMTILLLIGIVVLIGGLNLASRGVTEVFGPNYPQMIEYNGELAEGQLQVLGRSFSLSPTMNIIVGQLVTWQEHLERFLGKVEELVKKHGRQTQEMIRNLKDKQKDLFV